MDGNKLNGVEVNEAQLLDEGYRKYSGKEINIFYNKNICEHAGECVRGSAQVYEVGRKPWIIADNESADRNVEIINRCPSGALKYIRVSKGEK